MLEWFEGGLEMTNERAVEGGKPTRDSAEWHINNVHFKQEFAVNQDAVALGVLGARHLSACTR